jgi:hypothetical protein
MTLSSGDPRMDHELDPLQMALISVCRDSREALHTLHAHAEDWLSRPLSAQEVESAIGAMERAGLIAAYRRDATEWVAVQAGSISWAELRFLATPTGAEAAAAAWQRFFSE